jgi:hypothetical protein
VIFPAEAPPERDTLHHCTPFPNRISTFTISLVVTMSEDEMNIDDGGFGFAASVLFLIVIFSSRGRRCRSQKGKGFPKYWQARALHMMHAILISFPKATMTQNRRWTQLMTV